MYWLVSFCPTDGLDVEGQLTSVLAGMWKKVFSWTMYVPRWKPGLPALSFVFKELKSSCAAVKTYFLTY